MSSIEPAMDIANEVIIDEVKELATTNKGNGRKIAIGLVVGSLTAAITYVVYRVAKSRKNKSENDEVENVEE